MLLCDHTLRPLAGPKHWPQDGAPGGMRWGMSQDRVAAPSTHVVTVPGKDRDAFPGYRLACASHSHGSVQRYFVFSGIRGLREAPRGSHEGGNECAQ